MPVESLELASTQCCIAGGGPAGVLAGLLLARAGVDVLVLEKYPDFFRDFRGDTIHPSTLELMHELGYDDELLRLPHQEVRELAFHVGAREFKVADFSHLGVSHSFIALMPQWDFLSFLAKKGARYPGFRLRMNAEVTGLVERDGRITGVHVNSREGNLEVRADLVLGADGRHSTVRQKAGLEVDEIGAPIDVLWFRLSRPASDPDETMARLGAGNFMVMLNRDDYWQCAFVIAKGDADKVRQRGLFAFRRDVVELAPFVKDRVEELNDWDEIKLLAVAIDRLRQWYRRGLLCIGDSAHAMSPVGGVGINLAIQDAVAAANILAAPLREGRVNLDHLRAVQERREWPARVTQAVQVQIQNRILRPILSGQGEPKAPLFVQLLDRIPLLRRLPAYAVGIGARPEHIQTPEFTLGGA
jgi:2-polyprenyl-6-methoxyphenol hydroxylase-like FAD-dependent oxidoreductase